MEFQGISNMQMLEMYKAYLETLGESHSITMRVQEEIYCRMGGVEG